VFERQTDRQTDGEIDSQTPFSSLVCAGILCSAEKRSKTISKRENVTKVTLIKTFVNVECYR